MNLKHNIMEKISDKQEEKEIIVPAPVEENKKDEQKKAVRFLYTIGKFAFHKIIKNIDLIVTTIETLIALKEKPIKDWGFPIGSLLGKIDSLFINDYRTVMKQLNHNFFALYSYTQKALKYVS